MIRKTDGIDGSGRHLPSVFVNLRPERFHRSSGTQKVKCTSLRGLSIGFIQKYKNKMNRFKSRNSDVTTAIWRRNEIIKSAGMRTRQRLTIVHLVLSHQARGWHTKIVPGACVPSSCVSRGSARQSRDFRLSIHSRNPQPPPTPPPSPDPFGR